MLDLTDLTKFPNPRAMEDLDPYRFKMVGHASYNLTRLADHMVGEPVL